VALRHIHSFVSREEAFRDDGVLQELVIFHVVKGAKPSRVFVSASTGPEDRSSVRAVDYCRIVRPDDPQLFIRIPIDGVADRVAEAMCAGGSTLEDLGLSVSTGRVVDFRARKYLRDKPVEGAAPRSPPRKNGAASSRPSTTPSACPDQWSGSRTT
jgi:adenine-specific DNA-methyltransferase